MDPKSDVRYIIAGELKREYIITPGGRTWLDQPGGGLPYAASGFRLWGQSAGLISRIGEDYPHIWLDELTSQGHDIQGIAIQPQSLDTRLFVAYPDGDIPSNEAPVSYFADLGIIFPRSLLGYHPPVQGVDSRSIPGPFSIRKTDIPEHYLDASAAHLCPMDFLSHTVLPAALLHGQVTTITIEPDAGYMLPSFWDDIPAIVKGLTAFIVSEKRLASLFQGRVTEVWEMADIIASYGCDCVVVKRGNLGQYLYEQANHHRWVIPAYPGRLIDPTGCGDTFGGGFLAGYTQTYSLLEAVLYGNIAASLAIEGSGPFYIHDSLPGLAAARLDALREQVHQI
jgi:sugar/nucleoside kinase (ribokinase family)